MDEKPERNNMRIAHKENDKPKPKIKKDEVVIWGIQIANGLLANPQIVNPANSTELIPKIIRTSCQDAINLANEMGFEIID